MSKDKQRFYLVRFTWPDGSLGSLRVASSRCANLVQEALVKKHRCGNVSMRLCEMVGGVEKEVSGCEAEPEAASVA